MLAATAVSGCAPLRTRAAIDVVLAGGLVIDGTGAAPQFADVAIRGDTVVAVAPGLRSAYASSARIVDVTGLVVAPGFVEPHAHITTIDRSPDATNYLRQGVTTIVASLHSLDQPYPLGAFLDSLRVAPNTVWTAGHTWLRTRVLGLASRAPHPDELRQMERLAVEAMDDGAIGLGTGLEYVPAAYARPDELVALARAVARPGAVYVTHLRNEGAGAVAALDEAIGIGRRAGLGTHVSHMKCTGRANRGLSTRMLEHVDAANASGARVTFDAYAYTAYSTHSDVLFPAWALADGTAGFNARVADAAQRERLRQEMWAIYEDQTIGSLESVQFRDGPAGFEGRTLTDYVRSLGRPSTPEAAIETLIELQSKGGFLAVFHAMDDGDVDAFLRHPAGCVSADGDLVTFGKGVPHPRSYGGFPRVLARYVRERRVLELPEAIRKMTSAPALAHGLEGRGVVRPGYRADLVAFDAANVADRATFSAPHQYPVGITHVLVNGELVIEGGAPTGRRPGRPLRLAADGKVR